MIDLLLTKRNMDTVGGKTFSKEELYDRTPRVYKRDASQVRFLLGGNWDRQFFSRCPGEIFGLGNF